MTSKQNGKSGKGKGKSPKDVKADDAKNEAVEFEKAKQRLRGTVEARVRKERQAFEEQLRLVETAVVTRGHLRAASRFMLPNHYEDVVTERALTLKCGYPVCANHLPPSTPNDLLHPRLRFSFARGVYDESHLIPYCSKECYAGDLFSSTCLLLLFLSTLNSPL